MSEKGGCWHGIKTDILRIIYFIFHVLNLKSVLVFFTVAPTSFDETHGLNHFAALARNLSSGWLVLHNMVKAVVQHRRLSVAVFKKKGSLSIKNEINIVIILIEFFISTNHEFSQIALLQVYTLAHQDFSTLILFKQHKIEINFLMWDPLVNNISKYNSSISNVLSVSGSPEKLNSRRKYITYSWLGFGNHMVRWWGFQSNQVIKPIKEKV